MRSRLLSLVILAAAAIFLSGSAVASERTLELDSGTTTVTFDLGATGHDVHGIFEFQRGRIVFDPESGKASGEIVVDARRGDSGSKKRDKTMHRKVLESEEFPLFVFTPQRVEGEIHESGSSDVKVHGTMLMLGKTHPLTMATQVKINGNQVAVEASFDVPYIEWGMHDPSILFLRVAKQVQVSVEAKGTLGTAGESTQTAVGR
jgi:polyisoprenoid-binding protein YceI